MAINILCGSIEVVETVKKVQTRHIVEGVVFLQTDNVLNIRQMLANRVFKKMKLTTARRKNFKIVKINHDTAKIVGQTNT